MGKSHNHMPGAPPIHLKWFQFSELSTETLYAILALRQEVFVVEQDCAYLDADGRDRHAWHLVATNQAGECVGYLRVVAPGFRFSEPSIGRVVTRREFRREGIGAVIVREGIRKSREVFGPIPIRISAQAHLQRYYGTLGFVTEGDGNPYDEDGIPHVQMLCPAPEEDCT
jgi:ElaA protein